MRFILPLFFIFISCYAYSGSSDHVTASSSPTSKQKVKLSNSQRDSICRRMMENFDATINTVENYTKKPFVEGYKDVSCLIKIGNGQHWQLIGQTFSSPPDMFAYRQMISLLQHLKENNENDLLKYIYQSKDDKGRGVYDYIEIMAERHPKHESYYRRIRRMLNRYDKYH